MQEQSETTETQTIPKKEAKKPEDQSVQRTENQEHYARDPRPETHFPEQDTQNTIPETPDPEPDTQNTIPEIHYPEPETQDPEPRTEQVQSEAPEATDPQPEPPKTQDPTEAKLQSDPEPETVKREQDQLNKVQWCREQTNVRDHAREPTAFPTSMERNDVPLETDNLQQATPAATQEIELERESQPQTEQAQPEVSHSEPQPRIPDSQPSLANETSQTHIQQTEEMASPESLQPEPKPFDSQTESTKTETEDEQSTQEISPGAETEQPKTQDARSAPTEQKQETEHRSPETDAPEPSDDEDILKFIEETKQKIYIIGAGGSGSNTLDRLFELGTTGASLVAMNTDAKHLLKTRANRKIILGKKTSRGRGAGSNPAIGEKAAKESVEEIQHAIGDGSLVFITCGLGGGTGTGSAPIIAEAAKSAGALTVAVVTLPFSSEGKIRMDNALQGMDRLRKHIDTLIVIKNDKLLNLVPDLPLNTAFKVCDEVLAGSVKGIAELVTRSGLVNVDFADLRTILTTAGFAAIGLGEASLDAKQEDRARVAVETAISSPLLDADISSSTRALINVIGGEDMTLKEAEFIVAETSRRINPNAHIIWGARVEENIKKSSMRVLVVLAGVKFPKYEYQAKDADVDELDLDLIG